VDPWSVVLTLGSVVLGAVITGGATLLSDSLQERRRARAELRAYNLERLRRSERMLQARLDQITAVMRGDVEASKAANETAARQEGASLYLVGDDDVARAYSDLLVLLSNRVGQAYRIEDQIQAIDVMGRVSKSLGDQEARVASGLPLRELSAGTIAALSDVRAMADRFPLFDIQPNVKVRVARQLMRFWGRRSARAVDGEPNGRAPRR
jgi:hypothetical protein